MGIFDILGRTDKTDKKVTTIEQPQNNQERIVEYLKKRTQDLDWAVGKQEEYSVPTTKNQKLEITGNGENRIIMYLFEVGVNDPSGERKAICGLDFSKVNEQWQIGSTYLDSCTHLPETEVKVSQDILPFYSLMDALSLVVISRSLKENPI